MRYFPLRGRSGRRIPSLRQEREQSVKAARAADLPRAHGALSGQTAAQDFRSAAGHPEPAHAGGRGPLNWRGWVPKLWSALRPFSWRPHGWWETRP